MKILVTGGAGFIASHTISKLLKDNHEVVSIDYKKTNNKDLLELMNYRLSINNNINHKFYELDISNYNDVEKIFKDNEFDCIINLGAKAGVRATLDENIDYINSNIIGFSNILNCAVKFNVNKVIYASSSSVYGDSEIIPSTESQTVDNQKSFYAVSKKTNEVMANFYINTYKLNVIGLRFFTVYGEMGRIDMFPMMLAKAVSSGNKINVFNNGNMIRDFTYVGDVANAICKIAYSNIENSTIYNIGYGKAVNLVDFIRIVEKGFNKKANINYVEANKNDVKITSCSNVKFCKDYCFEFQTNIEDGLKKFIKWYKEYYNEN